jgi:outer membrane protein assembly factor BamB
MTGRVIIPAVLVGLVGAAPSALADAPGSELLWVAATRPVRAGSAVSIVPDAHGDGVSDVLIAGWGRRGAHDVLLLDGASGVELWRRRFEDDTAAPAVWADLPRGPSVLVAHDDVLSVIALRSGEVTDEVGLRGPIGEIAVGRLGGDGAPDVVYSAGRERNDLLVALSGADLSELWSASAEPDDSRFGNGFSRLAVLDLDGDGIDEIFLSENMRSVAVLSADGAPLWRRELAERTQYVPKGGVSGGPVLDDFLGGGVEQLAVGLWAGKLVVVDPPDGEILAEHLFGADAHTAHARNRRLPRFLKTLLLDTGEPVNELLAVELDGVSGREIVFGCSDGVVYAVSPRSGRVLWSFDAEGQVFDRPVAVDVSGDGVPDAVVWNEEGTYLIDGVTGRGLSGFPQGRDLSQAVLADLDGGGTVELIELRRDGSVRSFTTEIPCARAPLAPGCVE